MAAGADWLVENCSAISAKENAQAGAAQPHTGLNGLLPRTDYEFAAVIEMPVRFC